MLFFAILEGFKDRQCVYSYVECGIVSTLTYQNICVCVCDRRGGVGKGVNFIRKVLLGNFFDF